MAKRIEPYDGATAADREMRRRIAALTAGIKPTREMVDASIAPLLKKIGREAAIRTSIENAADSNRRAMDRAGRRSEKPNPSELAALKAYRKAVLSRRKRINVSPPKVQPFPPQIRSGSIWVAVPSPYTDRWTSGINAAANRLVGTWSTRSSEVNNSLAGICTFFTPVPGRFNIRFAPYMPISYSYRIGAYQLDFPPSFTVTRASSAGFVGAFVSAWDGREWVEMADVRNTIWDRRVSLNDELGEEGDSAWWTPQANFPAVGNPLTFALWAWGGVSTSARDGTFGSADSTAAIAASVPYMIIEQMI